jgi:hypothetical protein
MSKLQIGRELGLDHRTVRRWMHSDGFQEHRTRRRVSSVEAYARYLEQRLQEGCHNATQLWRELREQGFHGQQRIVRTWIRRRRGPSIPTRSAYDHAACYADIAPSYGVVDPE